MRRSHSLRFRNRIELKHSTCHRAISAARAQFSFFFFWLNANQFSAIDDGIDNKCHFEKTMIEYPDKFLADADSEANQPQNDEVTWILVKLKDYAPYVFISLVFSNSFERVDILSRLSCVVHLKNKVKKRKIKCATSYEHKTTTQDERNIYFLLSGSCVCDGWGGILPKLQTVICLVRRCIVDGIISL